MEFSSTFNSDNVFESDVFGNIPSSELKHVEIPLDHAFCTSVTTSTKENDNQAHQQRAQQLQETIQQKQSLLSMNRDLQNQLFHRLSIVESLLSNSQKTPFQPAPMPQVQWTQIDNESEEELLQRRKKSTRQLLQSFPVQGSQLFFSKRKKCYPRYTTVEGVPLTYASSPSPLHLQFWNQKDNERLSQKVMTQCQQMVAAGSYPNALRIVADAYMSTTDPSQKLLLLHNLVPSLLNQFSWESISYELNHSATDCFVHWINQCDPYINSSPWEIQEDVQLKSLIEQYHESEWVEIAKELNTGRTPFQCFERFVTSLEMKDYNVKWTKEDDEMIKEGVKQFGTKAWKKVASLLPNRSWTQCRSRYYQSLLQESRKGHWSELENARLLLLLFFYGISDWKIISKNIITRNPAQCRDRWYNVLDPTISKQKWKKAEDMKLLKLTRNKKQVVWKTICKHFPGRTGDACKTRYYTLIKLASCIDCFSSTIRWYRMDDLSINEKRRITKPKIENHERMNPWIFELKGK